MDLPPKASDEQPRILEAMPEGYRDVVRFALMSGCRLAECVGLRWADVDWGAREISILGKGNKRASIPLTTEMRALLFPLQAQHPDQVFTYPRRRNRGLAKKGDREPITYEGMKTAWRRAIKVAGVENFRFHDLRHRYAVDYLKAGGSIYDLQRLMGHSSVKTTEIYLAHLTPDEARQATAARAAL